MLSALGIEGRALEPLRLLALAVFLESIEHAAPADPPRAGATFPDLDARRTGGVVQERDRRRPPQDRRGRRGSRPREPRLRIVRDRLRKQRARLRGTLESYLRGKDTSKYLQEQVVTERNGRYVIVVRAEHRTRHPGHRPRELGERRQPVSSSRSAPSRSTTTSSRSRSRRPRRSAASCSRSPMRSARRAVDLQRTIEVATELDVLQAKARSRAGRRRRAGDLDRRPPRAPGCAPPAADAPTAAAAPAGLERRPRRQVAAATPVRRRIAALPAAGPYRCRSTS